MRSCAGPNARRARALPPRQRMARVSPEFAQMYCSGVTSTTFAVHLHSDGAAGGSRRGGRRWNCSAVTLLKCSYRTLHIHKYQGQRSLECNFAYPSLNFAVTIGDGRIGKKQLCPVNKRCSSAQCAVSPLSWERAEACGSRRRRTRPCCTRPCAAAPATPRGCAEGPA